MFKCIIQEQHNLEDNVLTRNNITWKTVLHTCTKNCELFWGEGTILEYDNVKQFSCTLVSGGMTDVKPNFMYFDGSVGRQQWCHR